MKLYEVKHTRSSYNDTQYTAKVVGASQLQVIQWAVKPRVGLTGDSGRVVSINELHDVRVAK